MTNRIEFVRRLFTVVGMITIVIGLFAMQKSGAATDPVGALLKARSDAITAFDIRAFDATMQGAPQSYIDREHAWLQRMRVLPLARYDLVTDNGEFGDLARAKDRGSFDEVRVVQAKERISLRGFDRNPTNEDMFLTIARKGATWSVVGDEAVEDLGLLSNRNVWDFGDVSVQQNDGVLVVFHPNESSSVEKIMQQVKAARARVQRAWPYGFHMGIVVVVPSSVGELSRILQTTFDLSNFVAFTASSQQRDGGFRLVGNRVLLQWENFKKYPDSFQTQLLAHELTHLATRDLAGPYHTPLIDEGIAQYYGEGGGHGRGELPRRIHDRSLSRYLIPNWYFTGGETADIFLAYEEAASFMKYLASRFGNDAGARLYKGIGEIDPVSPGTWRYHLDTVMQSLFHQGYASLERAWYEHALKEGA